MAVDLRISQNTVRLVFVYLLRIPYERKSFHDVVIDIEVRVTDAMDVRLQSESRPGISRTSNESIRFSILNEYYK